MTLSLWLVPVGEVQGRLARLIRELSHRHRTPAFEPHLTLLGGLHGPTAEIRRRAAMVASRLRSFPVRLTVLGHRGEHYRSLYVEVERTGKLLQARSAAEQALGLPGAEAFFPHVSLLYGEVPDPTKEAILDELGGELRLQFLADALYLYSTEGDPSDWRRLARFPLG